MHLACSYKYINNFSEIRPKMLNTRLKLYKKNTLNLKLKPPSHCQVTV